MIFCYLIISSLVIYFLNFIAKGNLTTEIFFSPYVLLKTKVLICNHHFQFIIIIMFLIKFFHFLKFADLNYLFLVFIVPVYFKTQFLNFEFDHFNYL